MDANQLKKKFLRRDRVVRVISKDGKFRAAAMKNSDLALDGQKRHNLSAVPAVLLARMLGGASLLASFLKGEERIIVEAEGNGPVKNVFAEALQVGEVRGFVTLAKNVKPDELKSISEAIGLGLFKVTRVLYNKREPVSGIVELKKGDVTTDLAYYLAQSEQIPSAVLLDVDVDDEGKILHSGGLIVQAMPGATADDVKKIQQSIRELPPITELLATGYSPEEILHQALPFEFDILNNTPVDFFCRCSIDKFKDMLLTLGVDEIRDMQKEGQNELVCKYCNQHYYLSEEDFSGLITGLKAKTN